ncbi:MAG TPA: AAA family ATPase [Candidatus Limnocylindria bacterium]|nr:AAA family ATPase [Candidatus Limnocylindria bacterium]
MPRSAPARSSRGQSAATTRAFLFSDLRGYTDYVERKGDTAAARLLKDYRALVRREVARHAGAEVKTEGDSFYVVFDSASAALECAVQVQRRAAGRNAKEADAPLEVGIGIHAGDTVAFDQQFVGSAVNVAARLASQAGAGEIVVSDTVRGLVRTSSAYPLRDRGELALKGVSERVRAWTVAWAAEPAGAAMPLLSAAAQPIAPAAGQLLCPVVVGRDAERSRARELVEAAAAGRGQTLVVGGEAGVGKSAFVRDVVAAATSLGFRLLYGATLESDAGLPYAPFVAAIRSGFRGLEHERLGRVLALAAPDLAELFPELGRAQRDRATTDQHRLAYAFAGLFSTFAREAPVIVAIEDLHWADEASLALLQYLSRELRDSRVLILSTYRSDEMHRRHPFLRVLTGLQRERLAAEIALRRLDREEVRELIRATFAARDPRVSVGEAFRDAIYARSEGNPFFTEELLKSLVESGDVYVDPKTGWERKPLEELQIPGSIKEAVRQRVEALSPDARATVAVAAVIGLQFTFDVLRAARGIDEATLEAHLRELMEGQLVVELGDDERYGFRHALSKEVVYDDLLVRERKRLHRAVVDSIEGDARTEPAIVAHHLLAAGEAARAMPHLLAAAARAMAAGAPREAAAHYARAIEIGVPDDELAATVERQAEAYHAFDIGLSIRTADEAYALYRERGDASGQSRMLRLAGRGHFYESRQEQAEEVTQRAIDVLGGDETPELARAVAQQAGLLMARSDMAAALPLAERAIEIARRTNDAWALANALITKGSVLPRAEGVGSIREGIALAVREGVVEAAMRGYNNLAIALTPLGRPADERLAVLDEAMAYARRHGVEQATLAYVRSMRSGIWFGLGRWDEALAEADAVHESALVYRWSLFFHALANVAREGPDAALPVAAELEKRGAADEHSVPLRAELAALYARAGRREEARAAAERLRSVLARYPPSTRELRTPRSPLGGPTLIGALTLAILTEEPEWIDVAEAELLNEELGRGTVEAARAVLAGDARACAEALRRAFGPYERTGLGAFVYEFAVTCVRTLHARGVALGPEWRAVAGPVRAFAEKVGARWWLAQLEAAGI